MHNLNLDLVGVDEVVAGHTETARGNLLDRRAAAVAVFVWSETIWIFTTFTGVGASADTVHCNRNGFVGFFGNRTVGHRASLEALHDVLDRLDFFEWNRLRFVEFKIHQSTEGKHLLGLIIDHIGILLEDAVVAETSRHLQLVDGDRIKEVAFSASAPLVDAASVECIAALVIARGICLLMACFCFLSDCAKPDTLNT